MPHLKVMSRRNCCLCDDAKVIIAEQAEAGRCTWEVVDVDRDKALLLKYGADVPVVLIDEEPAFMHRLSAESLQKALASASEGRCA